jgi:hypothetical protein
VTDQRDNKSRSFQPEDALLNDLESIRELLDEDQGDAGAGEEPDVPLLDDMVDGALRLEEKDLDTAHHPLQDAGRSGSDRHRNDALLDSLLGDQWKSSAADVLTLARGAIEAHRNVWTPQETDELNRALRERIDATLNRWLRETVQAHLDELRAELLRAAEAAITDRIEHLNPKHPEEHDPAARRSEDHG